MFPRISDLINYLLGTNLDIPVQSYGFMLALAFITGAWILYLELKRKEKAGQIHPHLEKKIKGNPASITELVSSGIFGFLLGWKLVGALINYSLFSAQPQNFILSAEGNVPGGILVAAVLVFFTFYTRKKKELKPPVWEEIMVHPYQLSLNILLIAAAFGIIGAKLFDALEHLDELIQDPLKILLSFDGLTFYGGLIVAFVAVIWYTHRNKIPFTHLIDAVAPALILAYAVGRIGCQISGDGCWGIANLDPKPGWLCFIPDWAWSFTYPHNVINDGILIPGCFGSNCHILAQPVYPVPLYETTIGLIIFLILWFIRKKLRIPGQLFSVYLILNGLERFFIEKIRINSVYDIAGIRLTQAEGIAVFLVVLGCIGLWYFFLLDKRNRTIISPSGGHDKNNT